MGRSVGPVSFDAWLDENGDRAAETLWDAALAMIERAVEDARASSRARWRSWPPGELRRLRRDVARAMRLARLAVALQSEENERAAAIDAELLERAAVLAKQQRREQTMEATRVRLANAAHRRAHKQTPSDP